MRKRVDKLGVSEPEIRKQGSNQIVIQLPAVHDVNQAAEIIGQTAQLELYDLETSLVSPSIDASQNPIPFTSLYSLLARVQSGQTGRARPVLPLQLEDEEARRRTDGDARAAEAAPGGEGPEAAQGRERAADRPGHVGQDDPDCDESEADDDAGLPERLRGADGAARSVS